MFCGKLMVLYLSLLGMKLIYGVNLWFQILCFMNIKYFPLLHSICLKSESQIDDWTLKNSV
jgi:hypothetical protein